MSSTVSVWGLDIGRQGEFMQVAALGHALGLDFAHIRLPPEGMPAQLPAGQPRLILSFGRAALMALRLAARFTPRPLLVQLGTPGKLPITAFDLILPLPQDDYPQAANVFFLRLPLNGAAPDLPAAEVATRRCTIIVGGPSRHYRLTPGTARRLIRFGARLAAANGEPLAVITSPRTPEPVLAELAKLAPIQGFTLHRHGEAPFARQLASGSRFLVTGDSASMLGEACRTGAPVWLFPVPRRPNLSDILQHGVDFCLGRRFRHRLVRMGWVGGGTDFGRWHRALKRDGHIQIAQCQQGPALRWAPAASWRDTDLEDCRARILGLLGQVQPLSSNPGYNVMPPSTNNVAPVT